MQIPVLLESVAGNGYRARSAEPFGLCAVGQTRDEALKNLRQALDVHLAAGAEILPLEIPLWQHPLAPSTGMLKDDPSFDEWQQTIAELRRQADAGRELRISQTPCTALHQEKNQAAIRLLQGWAADETGYDERTWPLVKETMEANRLSARKRCDD